jgi:hypothetical protein
LSTAGVLAVAPAEPACKFCGVDTKRPCVLANALECQNFGFYPNGKPARGVMACPPGHCRTPSAPCHGQCIQAVQPRDTNDQPVPCNGAPGVDVPVEIDRDTDGELLIDWSPSKGRMVTLSLRADGRLSYAFTWDDERAHGTAQMPAGVAVRVETALDKFNKNADLLKDETPLERLRYFLSHALNGQDWLDVEPFLDALPAGVPGTDHQTFCTKPPTP